MENRQLKSCDLGCLCPNFAQTRTNKGFTLIELLVIVAILAILTTMLMPFGASVLDNTKREKTVQVLDSLRFALIGAENTYDANGNRIVNGYVGEFNALPDLITHYWKDSSKEWVIQYYTDDGTNIPEVYDTDGSGNIYNTYPEDKFNQNAMPLALWTNFVKVGDRYQSIVDKDVWQGPYITREQDDFTSDDNVYAYYSVDKDESPADELNTDELDEMRKFWLRQGGGRLLDGWGSALLFYMQDDDLYVVSAGSDRQINYGPWYLYTGTGTAPDYDNGPADLSLSGNEDNIVMVLTKDQWDLTDQKTRLTQIKLKDIKTAILGNRGNAKGGVQQPNGFIADIGNLETLVGSYVYNTSKDYVYQCLERGTTVEPSTGTDDWNAIGLLDDVLQSDGTDRDESITVDYPYAYKWDSAYPRTYYPPQPSLLVMNADYVKVTSTTDSDDVTYYRYINDEEYSGVFNAAHWVEDDTFAGHDWVLEWDDSTTYTNEILPNWTYYSLVEFGAGWKGPYIINTTDPLTDAWGRQIVLEMDKNNLLIRSRGPQVYVDGSTTDYYEDDDIIETIVHTDYAVPATVLVKSADKLTDGMTSPTTLIDEVVLSTSDRVAVYFARNGSLSFGLVKNNSITSGDGDDGEFLFNRSYAYSYGLQIDINEDSSGVDTILYMPDFENAWLANETSVYVDDTYGKNGDCVPVGKVMVVYYSVNYQYDKGSTTTDYQSLATPHPDTEITTSSGSELAPLGYQKSFLIQARTSPTLVLGE